jgi:UDP-2,3-diacylglucosamine hydrolase
VLEKNDLNTAIIHLDIPAGKKIYFSSDNHLGAPTAKESLPRERVFVKWLEEIEHEAAAIFLLGDLFDFWFEYKKVVPKGFTRVLGTLARIADKGIPIFFFVGNHDLWMHDYFEEELGIPVFKTPRQFKLGDKLFFIGHGDGLGPGDLGFKRMKKVFVHPFSKWLFRWLHPDLGVRLGHYLSVKNKLISGKEDQRYLGDDKEWLVQYALRKLESAHYDYFIFGHRHLPIDIPIGRSSRYLNLGDWISYFSYGVYDGKTIRLDYFKKKS